MSSWKYLGVEVDEVPIGAKSFVYLITINGMEYIGKKGFFKKRTRPPLKGYKRKRVDYVESNWKTYCSSSDKVKELVMQGHIPTRSILRICKSAKEATWFENKMLYADITEDNILNDNISGKIFRKEILEWEQ